MLHRIHTGRVSDRRIFSNKKTIAEASAKFEELAAELQNKPLFEQMETARKILELHSEVRYAQNSLKVAEKVNRVKIFKNGSMTRFVEKNKNHELVNQIF